MFSTTSFIPVAGAKPVDVSIEAGEALTIADAHPELGRTLALLRRPYAGRVLFENRDLTQLNEGALRAVRRRLQYVGGDPRRALLPDQTLDQVLAEPLRIHRLVGSDEQRQRVERAAEAMRLPSTLLKRSVAELSTALRWRALIARSLTLKPMLLIVDAPTHYVPTELVHGLYADVDAARGGAAMVWIDPAA